MKRLVFSSVFEADFAEITVCLALDASPRISAKWEAALIHLLALLQKFPEMGRLRRDLKPLGIRTFVINDFPTYLLFYQLTADEIILLRIRHGGMDLTTLFAAN